MLRSLVGSEMCIRDRVTTVGHGDVPLFRPRYIFLPVCLLYTSDAADEEDSVDLGGRRIIKKKTPRRVPWTRHPPPPFAAPTLGIDQRPQILKPVRRDPPASHQLPQPVFHFASQTPGGAHEIVKE